MEQLVNNLAGTGTTLATSINSAVTALALTSASAAKCPASGNFRLVWATGEIMIVGAISGNNLSSITRGAEGTTAAAHNAGEACAVVLTAGSLVASIGDNAQTLNLLPSASTGSVTLGSMIFTQVAAVPAKLDSPFVFRDYPFYSVGTGAASGTDNAFAFRVTAQSSTTTGISEAGYSAIGNGTGGYVVIQDTMGLQSSAFTFRVAASFGGSITGNKIDLSIQRISNGDQIYLRYDNVGKTITAHSSTNNSDAQLGGTIATLTETPDKFQIECVGGTHVTYATHSPTTGRWTHQFTVKSSYLGFPDLREIYADLHPTTAIITGGATDGTTTLTQFLISGCPSRGTMNHAAISYSDGAPLAGNNNEQWFTATDGPSIVGDVLAATALPISIQKITGRTIEKTGQILIKRNDYNGNPAILADQIGQLLFDRTSKTWFLIYTEGFGDNDQRPDLTSLRAKWIQLGGENILNGVNIIDASTAAVIGINGTFSQAGGVEDPHILFVPPGSPLLNAGLSQGCYLSYARNPGGTFYVGLAFGAGTTLAAALTNMSVVGEDSGTISMEGPNFWVVDGKVYLVSYNPATHSFKAYNVPAFTSAGTILTQSADPAFHAHPALMTKLNADGTSTYVLLLHTAESTSIKQWDGSAWTAASAGWAGLTRVLESQKFAGHLWERRAFPW